MSTYSVFSIQKYEKSQLLASTLTASVIAIPICLMVSMYQDDFERAINGMYYWAGDGRPLSELIYRLMSFGAPQVILTSPLGTLLCIPGIIFSSLVLCRIFNHTRIWGGVLATILLFSSPYFIENLSFSFDAPLMVLAVFFSLSAAYLVIYFRSIYSSLTAVFLAVCSLSLYQSANASFWVPILIYIVFRIQITVNSSSLIDYKVKNMPQFTNSNLSNREIIIRFLLTQIFSLFIYKFFVIPHAGLLEYALSHGETPQLTQIPSTLIANVDRFIDSIKYDWDSKFGLVFGIFILFTSIYSSIEVDKISSIYSNNPKSKFSIFIRALFRLLACLAILIFSSGLSLLLTKPVFDPRTFIGVGVLLSSLSLCSTRYSALYKVKSISNLSLSITKDLFSVVVSFAAAWACIYILYSYANAYSSQQKLNHYYFSSIAQELRDNGYGPDDVKYLAFKGSLPRSPIVINTFRTLPVLANHDQIEPDNWHYWPNFKLMNFGFRSIEMKGSMDDFSKANLITTNKIYDLYAKDKSIFIWFHRSANSD